MLGKIIRNFALHLQASIPESKWHVGTINDLNSFPAISILRSNSADPQLTIRYIGADTTIATVRLLVRGYSYTDGEDSTASSDNLARAIETATMAYSHTDLSNERLSQRVEDAYVVSVETDEGLMSPYGICDIEIEMVYVQTK